MNYKVLIADDERHILLGFEDELDPYSEIEADYASNTSEVYKYVKRDPYGYAVIVLDYHYNDDPVTGPEIAKTLLKINPNLLIIIMTGDESQDATITSFRAGVKDFIPKNGNLADIIDVIRNYCKMYDETRRVVQAKDNINEQFLKNQKLLEQIGMVGWSNKSAVVAEKVLQLSRSKSNSPVLIRGESGTGKELVAKALHELSDRGKNSFIPINCTTIPENLLESELFGHEKGSFTGATMNKTGKFLLAHKGTLFLDEIGDMPPELQAKLLRVLQEGVIEPIGSIKPIKVDVKIIAATHVNLEEAVKEKKFREDLYYRLNVIPISLPPLRERRDDIEPLVLHFLEKHNGQDKKVLHKTLQYLKNYHWKGNVRELESTIRHLIAMVPESSLKPEHLDVIVDL